MRKQQQRLLHTLQRISAALVALAVLYGVAATAGSSCARDALQFLARDKMVLAMLRWELGDWQEDELSFATTMALGSTPVLLRAKDEVLKLWSAGAETESESGAEDEEKALNREVGRLRRSLQEASKLGGETVAFLHYPPVSNKAAVNELIGVLKEFDVKRCYYAHLHGASIRNAFVSEYEGVQFHLISGDSLGFCPKLIEKY